MRIDLHWRVLVAIVLGGLVGYLGGADVVVFGINTLAIYETLGTLFVSALKMVAVPLVVTSVIASVSRFGSAHALRRVGLRVLLLYVLTTLAAVLVAVTVFGLVKPGLISGTPAGVRMALDAASAELRGKLTSGTRSLADGLLAIVPPNLFEAARNGNLPGLIFFSLLIGYSLTRIESECSRRLSESFVALSETMVRTTALFMQLAPVGVFGLVAHTVAKSGLDALGPLLLFSATVIASLSLYALGLLPLLVRLAARVNPWPLFPAMAPALLTAFSTASSSASLATSIDCVERRVGVSKRVGGLVMSLGPSLNHAGTALYECVAVLFIAQACGVALSIGEEVMAALMALGTSMGIAGIPGSSAVAITAILSSLGLPAEAVGVLLVFDRVLDMCRTAVNVFADACCALIVATREGETT
jgi:Na+/H+-dicarboxylate symporter